MYSNSRLTRVLVFSLCITAFEMNFMATLCPVIVCIATRRQTVICRVDPPAEGATYV